jgi:hypothetical protein
MPFGCEPGPAVPPRARLAPKRALVYEWETAKMHAGAASVTPREHMRLEARAESLRSDEVCRGGAEQQHEHSIYGRDGRGRGAERLRGERGGDCEVA